LVSTVVTPTFELKGRGLNLHATDMAVSFAEQFRPTQTPVSATVEN
jgi:hypothetical protein